MNSARIVQSDQVAGQSVVDVVDRVMFPPEAASMENIRRDPCTGVESVYTRCITYKLGHSPHRWNQTRTDLAQYRTFSTVSDLGFYPIRVTALCVEEPSSDVLALVTSCGW